MEERAYPVGIQTFSEMIRGAYVYVDKTDLMWRMQHRRKYVFLSRPRRFGKSLLASTFHAFFAGERELFQGLKVMELEKDWNEYPVIHLDMSEAKGWTSVEELRAKLRLILSDYTEVYGSHPEETTPGGMLRGLVRRAYKQLGKKVVVIIDEYDAPLLDVLHEDEMLKEARKAMQELYIPLKANEQFIQFCFITGITKFSQLSIFSTINNLTNMTMWPQYASICGVTETELTTVLAEDIRLMAEAVGVSSAEMLRTLKEHYDGYRFAKDSEELYNPYSLFKAFDSREVGNYWFESGTPTFLIGQMQYFNTDIMSMEAMEASSDDFDKPTEAMNTALPLLYQSGYITIKEYHRDTNTYTLGIPNQEVRVGYTEGLLPAYAGLDAGSVKTGFAAKLWRALKKGDIHQVMLDMQTYLAGIPYVEGFKQKLRDTTTKEGFWEYTFYLIFSMLNIYVRTQVKCLGGRTDMVIWMPDTTYVFELKVHGTAQEALEQINQKGYALPFRAEHRRVVKVGVKCNANNRTIEEWVVEKE